MHVVFITSTLDTYSRLPALTATVWPRFTWEHNLVAVMSVELKNNTVGRPSIYFAPAGVHCSQASEFINPPPFVDGACKSYVNALFQAVIDIIVSAFWISVLLDISYHTDTPVTYFRHFGITFYPCDAMLARVFAIATCPSVCLSVRPSVHLSHAGIVPSRAKAGSWNVYHLIAPSL